MRPRLRRLLEFHPGGQQRKRMWTKRQDCSSKFNRQRERKSRSRWAKWTDLSLKKQTSGYVWTNKTDVEFSAQNCQYTTRTWEQPLSTVEVVWWFASAVIGQCKHGTMNSELFLNIWKQDVLRLESTRVLWCNISRFTSEWIFKKMNWGSGGIELLKSKE